MTDRDALLRTVRWPLVLVGIAVVLIVIALAMDNEMSLTIGGPALAVMLPVGVLWLALALVVHAMRSRRRGTYGPSGQD